MGVGQGVEESCPGRHCCAVLSWEPRLPASRNAPWRLGAGLGACGCPKGSHMRFPVCRESVLEGG